MSDKEKKHSSALASIQDVGPSYDLWFNAYNRADTVADKISLLHRGFSREYKPIPAIAFYLREAEGHVNSDFVSFLSEDEEKRAGSSMNFRHFEDIGKARQKIAQKAFDVLVTELFKNTQDKMIYYPSWLPFVANKDTLDALVHFFRIDYQSLRFVNLNRSVPEHKRAIVHDFLFKLATYGWKASPDTSGRDRGEHPETKDLFMSYRMQFMDILCGLGKLDTLLGNDDQISCREESRVGEPELAKLEELAMSKDYFFDDCYDSSPSHRKPVNIAEAAYEGSQAAQVAILLRSDLQVHARFKAKIDAERRIVQSRRELERLSATTK